MKESLPTLIASAILSVIAFCVSPEPVPVQKIEMPPLYIYPSYVNPLDYLEDDGDGSNLNMMNEYWCIIHNPQESC